jgi:hypothetical protein
MGNVLNLKPWPKGVSGNPAGRPQGARSKLEEAFLADMHKSWQENGAAVIAQVIRRDPVSYLRVAASILPKQILEDVPESLNRERIQRAISVIESWSATSDAEGSGPEHSEGSTT